MNSSEPPPSLTNAFLTPHDTFLSQFHRIDPEVPKSPQRLPTPQEIFDAGFHPAGPLDTVYDPFDGSVFGKLHKPARHTHPEAHTTPSDPNKEDLWLPLTKVLDLQSQVAQMHAKMEGIGAKAGDYKNKIKAAASQKAWNEEDEGGDVKTEADEEEKQNREREEEFARLAGQFEGRKQGIQDMMNKLDDLSKALTDFHALHAPKLDFPASPRHSSLPATSSTSPIVPSSPGFTARTLFISPSPSPSPSPAPAAIPPGALLVNTVEPARQSVAVESPISMDSLAS